MHALGIIGILLLLPLNVFAAEPYRIVGRSAWGADETFLYVNGETTSAVANTANDKTSEPDTIPQRQKECEEAHRLYPEEFSVSRTIRKKGDRSYRWPLQYGNDVRLLVLHHTAILNEGDDRSSEEKMRSLYEMHANGKGWGDIGYHYVIGPDGRIFEGKAGGDYVIGGHVYCGNIGTVGIALMGNFDLELPRQAQMRSLQWLLHRLQMRYDIDPKDTVRFHGRDLPPVVGHRDLLSTDCPGYYIAEAMDQIRSNVSRGDVDASVTFPNPKKGESTGLFTARQKSKKTSPSSSSSGVQAVGATTITGQPGGTAVLLVSYASGNRAVSRRSRIATVTRSTPRIGLIQEMGGGSIPVREDLLLPEDLAQRSTQSIRLQITLPTDPGTHTLTIGDVRYTLLVKGRRAHTAEPQGQSSMQQPTHASEAQHIRIRLSLREGDASRCTDIDLRKLKTQYRGALKCIELEGKPAIINTLHLEDYLAGLAEEPDTEPYEKQRAFAIAARTYAAYYMSEKNRKFPGMPYDGDDSPARFQLYKGIAFELKNTLWTKAVRDTAGKVLEFQHILIKPPYFSSDDGRTRSPEEIGWKNFPHAAIFQSKSDPWCKGLPMAGHGVGMSGCGAKGQAKEGKTAEQILMYYYPSTKIERLQSGLSP